MGYTDEDSGAGGDQAHGGCGGECEDVEGRGGEGGGRGGVLDGSKNVLFLFMRMISSSDLKL